MFTRIRLHEIHKDGSSIGMFDYAKDERYAEVKIRKATYDVCIAEEPSITTLPSGKEVVSLELEFNKPLSIMEFIKHLGVDFSNAFILISPTEKQDIIVDFTMNADDYYKVLESNEIIRQVTDVNTGD